MSASWIRKLNESDSRLHKEDVIKQALEASVLGSTNAQIFLGLLKACYNPYVTFNVRQVPDTVGITDAENPWSEFNELLLQLSRRQLTSNQQSSSSSSSINNHQPSIIVIINHNQPSVIINQSTITDQHHQS